MRRIAAVGCVLALFSAGAAAQNLEPFPPEQIKTGAAIYAQNCSGCHGARMADPQGAFNLRQFPPDQKSRFVNSVTKGKNSMPPWATCSSPRTSMHCGRM